MSHVCPSCQQACDELVVDAPGTELEFWICEPCHRCTEIIVADAAFLTDPKYNTRIGENPAQWIRRMHEVLL